MRGAAAPGRDGVQGRPTRAKAPGRALGKRLLGPDRAAPRTRDGAAVRTGRTLAFQVRVAAISGGVSTADGPPYDVGGRAAKVAVPTAPKGARGAAFLHLMGAG